MTELFKVRATGPLASHVEGFCAALVRMGYTPRTARDHGYVLVHLSRWLAAERLQPSELTSSVVERFLGARRRAGYRRWRSARSLRPLLAYLGEVAGVPAWRPNVAEGPVDRLLDSYGRYLRVERRLAPSTALLLFLWVRFGGAAQGAGPLLPGQGRLRRRCARALRAPWTCEPLRPLRAGLAGRPGPARRVRSAPEPRLAGGRR